MYVKNNTGVISMTTDAGNVLLAQGQSAFAASSADLPQQTTQPPVAYHLVMPDHFQADFDTEIVNVADAIGSVSDITLVRVSGVTTTVNGITTVVSDVLPVGGIGLIIEDTGLVPGVPPL